MNPIKSVHPSHSTQPHSFAPVTNHLKSNNFSTVAQASNQFGIKANPQASAPLQPNPSIFPSQHMASQAFPQMNSNAGIQTAGMQAAQGIISEALPHSETASTLPENNYPHQISGLGGPTATAPFLQDFSLVAEAARRAQLSIVMRDLESVTL